LVAFLNNGFLLNRDLGADFRIVTVDIGSQRARFQWKLSNQRAYNAEVEVTLSKFNDRARAYHLRADFNEDGTADDSGLFVYFNVNGEDFNFPSSTPSSQSLFPGDRYFLNVTFNEGKSVTLSDQNTVHSVVECSGRGACERARGECKCYPGFGGDACQRAICPNGCSSHGTCQNLKYFVEEGTNNAYTYTGVDATQQMGCKCDIGFRGFDCSQMECPSGPDPLGGDGGNEGLDCSSRGVCDFNTGTCMCFKGFAGECHRARNAALHVCTPRTAATYPALRRRAVRDADHPVLSVSAKPAFAPPSMPAPRRVGAQAR